MRKGEADTDVMIDAEMISRDNQDALVPPEPIGHPGGVDIQVVSKKRNGTGLRRCETEGVLMFLNPTLKYRVAVTDVVTGAFQKALTHVGR